MKNSIAVPGCFRLPTCYRCEERIALRRGLIQPLFDSVGVCDLNQVPPTACTDEVSGAGHLKSFVKSIHVFLLLVMTLPLSVSRGDSLTLWYSKPGVTPMTEALPIGNGRLGGMTPVLRTGPPQRGSGSLRTAG